MNNPSRLLIILAATASGLGAAEAADLSFRDVPVAQHLGSCGAFEAGAFALPGTDACLRISGGVVAEYTARLAAPGGAYSMRSPSVSNLPLSRDLSSSRVGGFASVDIRMPTELGPVRVYVSLRKPNWR
jgi:hypothetical protein